MRKTLQTLAAAIAASVSLTACAGALVDLSVVGRSDGQTLQTYAHRGQNWVAGNPGERYAVRLTNRTGARVLAVLSVDGVNAVTGETADPAQGGYVLDPYESAEITGWRKSLQEVAAFYFTALPDSYAARTDRPDHVGVIGVAVYREKERPRPTPQPPLAKEAESAARDAAPAGAAAPSAPAAESRRRQEASRLGTGHGEREQAPTQYIAFDRASRSPAEVVSLRYDSWTNLVARGVVPRPPRYADPQPFPGGRFVPDPKG
jgi:hypothetical protein